MNSATLEGDTEHLRKHFHEEIDRMDPLRLATLRKLLLLIKLNDIEEGINRAFDTDAAAGRLTPEKIAQVVREVRASRR